MCYNIASVFMFCFFDHEAWGNLSSLTRDQTSNPCIGRQSLNHWATQEVQVCCELCFFGYLCHFTLENIFWGQGLLLTPYFICLIADHSSSKVSLKIFVVVIAQSLNHVWLFAAPWTAALQASMSFTISWSLLKLMSIKSVMPPNHLILCYSLLQSQSFRFSIGISNEYSRLIPLGLTG